MKTLNTNLFRLRVPAFGVLALALSTVAAFASPVTTNVGYDPNASEGNFATGPEQFNDVVAYSMTLGSDATNLYVTLQANPAGYGNDNWTNSLNFANLYFGTGSNYNQGADFGVEVTNLDAFIPGGVQGAQDLGKYGVTDTTTLGTTYNGPGTTAVGTSIELALPWTYLETDPENLGFETLSAANPYVELRDSQSFSYSYVGGSSYGDSRFGIEADPNFAATPEPSTWMMLLAGGVLMGFAYKRRLKTARVS